MNDIVLLQTLSRLQPLAALGEDSLRGLMPLCHHEKVTRNLDATALRDWRGQVIYLHKGELKLDFADGGFQVLVGGSDDALFPIGKGTATPVTTKAITDVELLRFDADSLDIIVTWDQLAAKQAAVRQAAPDWRAVSGVFTAQSFVGGLFAPLPPANIDALLGRLQRIRVKRGEVIVRQGDLGDYYYVIESGRCQVARQVAGASVDLAELKSGEAFGEEALLQETTRNATVTMRTDGVLLRLDKSDFNALLKEPLLLKVGRAEAERRVAAGARWIDVRFPAECQHDGLAGALNLPLNELRQAMDHLDPGPEYIVYCQSGRRSSAAAFLLSQRGFKASLLEGGMDAGCIAKDKVIQ